MARPGAGRLLVWALLASALLILPPSDAHKKGKCSSMKSPAKAREAAAAAMEEGKLEVAEGCCRMAIQLSTTAAAKDWEMLGMIKKARDNFQGALDAFERAVKADGRDVEIRLEYGNALLSIGNVEKAMEQYQMCAQMAPNLPGPYINAGNVHLNQGRFKQAETFYRKAIELDGTNLDALVNLGVMLANVGRGEDAVVEYRKALKLQPNNVDALLNLGALLVDLGDVDESLRTYERALKMEPEKAELRYNTGNALIAAGRFNEALESFQLAVKYDPAMVRAKCAAAGLLAVSGNYSEAKKLAGQAARSKWADPMWRSVASCIQISLQIETGERGLDLTKKANGMVSQFVIDLLVSFKGGEGSHDSEARLQAMSTCITPFKALYYPGFSEQTALLVAVHASRQAESRARALPRLLPRVTELVWSPGKRLELGYMFVGHSSNEESLMSMLFLARHSTAHDGRRRIHCYCLRQEEDNPVFLEIKLLCGQRFKLLSALSHSEAARAINRDDIHILVDTVGHTPGARPEVLAMNPAPLQLEVRALGSYGSAVRRTFLTDRVATPPEFLPPRALLTAQILQSATQGDLPENMIYSEAVTLLPAQQSFSFSHRHHHPQLHEVPLRTATKQTRDKARQRLGINPDSFVFVYAGRLNGIEEETLDAWAKILEGSPRAVLVLPAHPAEARNALIRRASRLGLQDDSRLIWDTELALNTTLRLELLASADLFLDSPGMGTRWTASEALLTATPILALPQLKLSSRTTSSMILSVYPEFGGPPLLEDHPPYLIVRDWKEYVELSIRIASQVYVGSGDWRAHVPYHDIRAALLEQDGKWHTEYNKGIRLMWECHLLKFSEAAEQGTESQQALHPLQPHVIVH